MSVPQGLVWGLVVTAVCLPFWGLMAQSLVFLAQLTSEPSLSFTSRYLPPVLLVLSLAFIGTQSFRWTPQAISLAPKEHPKKPELDIPPIMVCGMEFNYWDLFVNFLITGRIGSGKTAVAIWSIVDQMFTIFSRQTQAYPGDLREKMGGLAIDAKGDFAEAMLYFVDKSGRNVLDDVRIIRPKVRFPVARFIDERGYSFYVSGLRTTRGTEFGRLISRFDMAEGQRFPVDLLDQTMFERQPIEDVLRKSVLDVRGMEVKYIGWRKEGNVLLRVSHTPAKGEIEFLLNHEKAKIAVTPPQQLTFVEVIGVDNGLRFNIINPRLSAAEAAKRLVNIGKLVAGDSGGGDANSYFSDAAARQIGMCIEAWRMLRPESEITGPDILRISSQRDALKELTEGLRNLSQDFEKKAGETKNPDRVRELRDLRTRAEDIRKYFVESWDKLEPKTKGITESVIQNMFGMFITDANLKESFCSPSTINFTDAFTKGTFFCFSAGREYEGLQKVLATSLKQEFQSAVLTRPESGPHVNKTRTVALIVDECQTVAVAGGKNGSGDEHFKAVARQARCCSVDATQSESSIIGVVGRDNGPVYLQPYGGRIWMANTDPQTNENASKMCGKGYKERPEVQGNDFKWESLVGYESNFETRGGQGQDYAKLKNRPDYELNDRFRADEFASLDNLESITLNMGQQGKANKVKKFKNTLHPYASADGAQKLTVLLNWYSTACIEQEAWRAGKVHMFDHVQQTAGVQHAPAGATVLAPAQAPAQATTQTTVPPAPAAPATPTLPQPGGAMEAMKKLQAEPQPQTPPHTAPETPAPMKPSEIADLLHLASDAPAAGERKRMILQPKPAKPLSPPPAQEEEIISFGDLNRTKALFQSPDTQPAMVAQSLEQLVAEPLLNRQRSLTERILSGVSNGGVQADREAIGPKGSYYCPEQWAERTAPRIPQRKMVRPAEQLDLAAETRVRVAQSIADATKEFEGHVPSAPAKPEDNLPTAAAIKAAKSKVDWP